MAENFFDRFSIQSKTYKKFRPTYPAELYDFIYKHCENFETVWDSATGNGQVASALCKKFKHVFATDLSKNQLAEAPQFSNVTYSVSASENTDFKADSFDLITVAQAIHWFNFEAFNKEVLRVLKPTGTLAVWGYENVRITPEIDQLFDQFYTEKMGKYWDVQRKFIDSKYQNIPLHFQEIEITEKFSIKESWSLEHFEGYLNSWSSVQNYIKANKANPVNDFIATIATLWDAETKTVEFPIFIRIARKSVSDELTFAAL